MSKALVTLVGVVVITLGAGVVYVAGAAGPIQQAEPGIDPEATADTGEPPSPGGTTGALGREERADRGSSESESTTLPAPREGAPPWMLDIDEARARAEKEGKHLLVNFTGLGWCGYCEQLEKEVFAQPDFRDRIDERYLYVLLDFEATGDARRSSPFAAKNDALANALGVEAFPTVILMSPEGVPYDQMGYERGGPLPYASKLMEKHDRAESLRAAVPAAQGAAAGARSAAEAMEATDRATALLTDAGAHALAQPLVPIVASVLESEELPVDREVGAIRALSRANAVDEALINRAFRVDPANASGLPEGALAAAMRTLGGPNQLESLITRSEALLSAAPIYDAQVASQLYGDCAYWIREWQKDEERASIMASFALGLKPTDSGLQSMLEDLIK